MDCLESGSIGLEKDGARVLEKVGFEKVNVVENETVKVESFDDVSEVKVKSLIEEKLEMVSLTDSVLASSSGINGDKKELVSDENKSKSESESSESESEESESSSSDSDSSIDEDWKRVKNVLKVKGVEMEEGEISGPEADEMVAWSEDEDDPKGPIKSKNELNVLPHVPPVDVTLQPHHETVPVGLILSMMGSQVIVESTEIHNPLEEGSVLFVTETRTPLGFVDETFGPVKSPYYIVRFNSEDEIPNGIKQGIEISYVFEFAKFVLNNPEVYKKGYDASNENDEELDEEVEFSDDEKEAEFRRLQKVKKRGGNEKGEGKKKKGQNRKYNVGEEGGAQPLIVNQNQAVVQPRQGGGFGGAPPAPPPALSGGWSGGPWQSMGVQQSMMPMPMQGMPMNNMPMPMQGMPMPMQFLYGGRPQFSPWPVGAGPIQGLFGMNNGGIQGQNGPFNGSQGLQVQNGSFNGSQVIQGQNGQFNGSQAIQGQTGPFNGSQGIQGQTGPFNGGGQFNGMQGQNGTPLFMNVGENGLQGQNGQTFNVGQFNGSQDNGSGMNGGGSGGGRKTQRRGGGRFGGGRGRGRGRGRH